MPATVDLTHVPPGQLYDADREIDVLMTPRKSARQRLASLVTDRHSVANPLMRLGLARRGLPFAGVLIIGIAVGLWASGPNVFVGVAAVALLISIWAAWCGNWESYPEWTSALPVYGWFVAVAALMFAPTEAGMGFEPLAILPALWFALYGTKKKLIASLATLAVVLSLGSIVGNAAITEALLDTAVWLASAVFVCLLVRRGVSMSITDSLTGVGNRRAMQDAIEAELQRAARFGHELSIAILDLDHFKRYNDERGHQAGDKLLVRAARRWKSVLRSTDSLFRYGGEEFLVVLPGASASEAIRIMERLRLVTPYRQTCSVGVAAWDGEELPRMLVRRADKALYVAKNTGRNCTAISPTPVLDLRDRERSTR